MRPRLASCLVVALACTASPTLADPVILLDDYENDTIGQSPGPPDVGTSSIWGTGHEIVAAPGSGKMLRSTCAPPATEEVRWYSTDQSSGRVRLSYRAAVTSNPTPADAVPRMDTFYVRKSGGANHLLRLHWAQGEQWSNGTTDLGDYSTGTTYDFVWIFDQAADTLTAIANGVVLATYDTPSDAVGIDGWGTGCDPLEDSVIDTDEVRAVEDPIFFSGFDVASPDEWSAYSPSATPGNECGIPALLGQSIDTPGTLDGHTGSTGDDSSCGSSDTIDRWLLYTAQCTGTAVATTCLDATEFDTVLAVYDACDGSQLTCNDDFAGTNCLLDMSARKSLITFGTVAGATYPIRVSVYADSFPAPDAKEFAVRVECVPSL